MLYGLTSFLGAFLLFQVQPLIAKYILPWYGGTPAVWTTCMLFFQAVLLAGYFYAHRLLHPQPVRRQTLIHAILLAACVASLAAQAAWWRTPLLAAPSLNHAAHSHPIPSILFILTLSVGLSSVMLATTSPVIQSWHARAWPDRSPYKLYALSNIGSLFALLSYPFLFEPALTLRHQARAWAVLFVAYAVLCVLCGRAMLRSPSLSSALAIANADEKVAPALGRRLLWFCLAGCGCLGLLATTNLVCQEIAVVPFLWILPLSLYLVTFIICFEFERFCARRFWTFALALLSVASVFALYLGVAVPLLAQILLLNATLFALCMVCHGELVRLRPAPAHLTGFYLAIAAGGCAGGLFASLVAPLVFSGLWEFHVALLAAWVLLMIVLVLDPASCVYRGEPATPVFLLPGVVLFTAFMASPQAARAVPYFDGSTGMLRYYATAFLVGAGIARAIARRPQDSGWHPAQPRWVLIGFQFLLAALLLLLFVHRGEFFQNVRAVTRNFYGVLRVTEDNAADPEWRHFSMRHGAILHGLQFSAEEKRMQPASYYTEQSGLGLACRLHPLRVTGQPMHIGVIGLGVGGIAAYGRAGDVIRFYEINPEVTRFAQDTNLFTYLSATPAKVEVVHGDARLSMERELREDSTDPYDLFVLDAFSSDSIPAHLLTREAFAVYLAHLRGPESWLALNISNRHIDLRPLIRAVADFYQLDSLCVEQVNTGEDPRMRGSTWILLARRGHLRIGATGENLYFNEDIEPVRLWTDDFSNLFDVLQ